MNRETKKNVDAILSLYKQLYDNVYNPLPIYQSEDHSTVLLIDMQYTVLEIYKEMRIDRMTVLNA